MPSQDQAFEVGSVATLPGWGAINNTGIVPLFPTDLHFNANMEIVGDEECAQMYEARHSLTLSAQHFAICSLKGVHFQCL